MQVSLYPEYKKGEHQAVLNACSNCFYSNLNNKKSQQESIDLVGQVFKNSASQQNYPDYIQDQIFRATSWLYTQGGCNLKPIIVLKQDAQQYFTAILKSHFSSLAARLPKDIVLEADDGTKIPTNLLILSVCSGVIRNMFKHQFREAQTFQATYPVTEKMDPMTIRVGDFSGHSLSVFVQSLTNTAIQLHEKTQLTDFLNYFACASYLAGHDENRKSMARIEQAVTNWMTERVDSIEHGNHSLEHALPFLMLDETEAWMSHFKTHIINILNHKITSVDQIKEILKNVEETEHLTLMENGLGRIEDRLSNSQLSNKKLFDGLKSVKTALTTKQIYADLVVERLPKSFAQKGWKNKFKKVALHIQDYRHLDIQNLSVELLSTLLDIIAPHVTRLNLSRLARVEEGILWATSKPGKPMTFRTYPNLVELDLSHSDISEFSAKKANVPNLCVLNLSYSPARQIGTAGEECPALTGLNVTGCENWIDVRSIICSMPYLKYIDITGCNEDFKKVAKHVAKNRKDPQLTVINMGSPEKRVDS